MKETIKTFVSDPHNAVATLLLSAAIFSAGTRGIDPDYAPKDGTQGVGYGTPGPAGGYGTIPPEAVQAVRSGINRKKIVLPESVLKALRHPQPEASFNEQSGYTAASVKDSDNHTKVGYENAGTQG